MDVTISQLLLIIPMVFLAGFVDSIAGGGGLISLPTYLVAGLPTHYAAGTNKLSAGLGTAMVTYRFARKGFIPWRQAPFYVACALVGSFIGANIALALDGMIFRKIMVIILPLIAAFILKGKSLTEEKEPFSIRKTMVLGMAISLAVGVYDGFYGPGTGTFLLLLLTSIAHMSVQNANGVAKIVNLTTNVTTLVVFLVNGKVIILLGLAAGLFSIAGNYAGSRFFERYGGKAVKPIMLIVITVFFIKLVVEML